MLCFGRRLWPWMKLGISDSLSEVKAVDEVILESLSASDNLSIDDCEARQMASLCVAVLDRLFPDAPAVDPVAVLLWCTGRIPKAAVDLQRGG